MLALAILVAEFQQEFSAGEKITFIDARPTALSKQNHIPVVSGNSRTLLTPLLGKYRNSPPSLWRQ